MINRSPTLSPTATVTRSPTVTPTVSKTNLPTITPTITKTNSPSFLPTAVSTNPPTIGVTASPTIQSSASPTNAVPIVNPTAIPTSTVPVTTPAALPTTAPTTLVPVTSNPTIQSTNAPTAKKTKRFSFRLDNIVDTKNSATQVNLLSYFLDHSISVTAGIIGNSVTGQDVNLLNALKRCVSIGSDKCSLAVQGGNASYSFGTATSVAQAKAEIQATEKAIQKLFPGYAPKVFIPTENTWNAVTLAAVRGLGYAAMSVIAWGIYLIVYYRAKQQQQQAIDFEKKARESNSTLASSRGSIDLGAVSTDNLIEFSAENDEEKSLPIVINRNSVDRHSINRHSMNRNSVGSHHQMAYSSDEVLMPSPVASESIELSEV
eukprot:gene7959-8602_t